MKQSVKSTSHLLLNQTHAFHWSANPMEVKSLVSSTGCTATLFCQTIFVLPNKYLIT